MEWTRRRLVGATLATAALAGCLGDGGSSASSGNGDGDNATNGSGGMDGHGETGGNETDESDAAERALEDAEVENFVGKDEIEITVDPAGAGFVPEAFEIDRRTVVNWVWEGSSTGLYPLDIPPECMWDEEDNENDEWAAGDTFDRLFWAPGAYLYASRDANGEEFTGTFRVVEADDSGGDGGGNGSGGNESDGGDGGGGNESDM